MCDSRVCVCVRTRSRTRENSGVLRVFSGRAGLRVSCSSVSGGTCLMKKYLDTEDAPVSVCTEMEKEYVGVWVFK